MASDPSLTPGPSGPDDEPGQPAPPAASSGAPSYAPLEDALARAVAPEPWWRRWVGAAAGQPGQDPAAPSRRRNLIPVAGALGVVLVLSVLGIAAPWNSNTSPARGGGSIDDGPVMASPTPGGLHRDAQAGRPQSGQGAPTPDGSSGDSGGDCAPALSVVVSPDIAPVVRDLAGSLAGGSCPQVTVSAQEPAGTLSTMAGGGGAPDVWIPGSTLWLRQATSGSGSDLPTSGTSIARSPVVLAVPKPVADDLAQEDAWPVWLVFYDKTVNGDIPRMSMADTDTTAGALALVSFMGAADYHWSDTDGAGFLQTIHFRDNLATTNADPEALLDRLATTAPAQSATQVGVFPATEQQLLAYNAAGPATRAVPYGTCEAMSEADYPMAVSQSLNGRLSGIAEQLRAELRSPAAVNRFVDKGFHPPRAASSAPFLPENICSNDPEPVAVPTAARWQEILDGWTWTG